MKISVTFHAKIKCIATYVTFCMCCDRSSSKRKYAWCKICTVDKYTENSTLKLCLTPFERGTGVWIIVLKTLLYLTTGSTLKWAVTSANLLICSFHINVRLMLFFGSWQTTLRSRYVKVQRYGGLTSFTLVLYILIWKNEDNWYLKKNNVKRISGTYYWYC